MDVAEEIPPSPSPDPPPTNTIDLPPPSVSSSSSPSPCSTTPLIFQHNEVIFSLVIPEIHFALLELQKNAFLASKSGAECLGTSASLAMDFLEFLLSRQCVSPSVLLAVVRAFDSEFLEHDSEIHSLVTALTSLPDEQQRLLGVYYRVVEASCKRNQGSEGELHSKRLGAIFQHVKADGFRLMGVFGGQGDSSRTCVKELAGLYKAYKPMLRRLIGVIGPRLNELSLQPQCSLFYKGQKLDLEIWVNDPSTIPDSDFISRAPVSVPIVGVLSLARYCIVCQIMGLSPGELRSLFQSTTGHSQGLLAAIVIAQSDSWDSFYHHCRQIIEVLFYLGWESHYGAPCSAVPATDSEQANHQNLSSYMLSVRGLKRSRMDSILRQLNAGLPKEQELCLSLINTQDQFIIAGPVASLLYLERYLTKISGFGQDQNRVPFSSRKPPIQHSFIPVSTPFHTHYLTRVAKLLKKRFANHVILAHDLMLPVYHTRNGRDLRQITGNILHTVIEAIVCERCDWPTALSGEESTSIYQSSIYQPSISHIIVFDRGGLGPLVKRVKEGWGVRVIQGGELDSRDPEMGTLHDLFSRRLLATSTRLQSWSQRFQPRLSSGSPTRLETRLSRLLGAPPVVVAGMTPTTMHTDFVAAIMNAGYHVELAAGGYYDATGMAAAIQDLVRRIAPGRGIACNLIYANPRSMAWQIALLRRLSQAKIPIDGLTIGAGVPTPEVAAEYIQTLGLRYIGFKPGSVSTIRQVVEIAKAHAEFPVILQWTGGRGGGHHSFEDFHEPVLATYALIRQHSNIYLVAGSGFGSGESIYPYLTGSWSLPMGRPAMPFDGVLLGSRMMVAKEAHTSPAVRKIITKTSGVPDKDWVKTYTGSAGGVITVRSEMGEPIHKIATRGVRLWADMDRTVFNLPHKDRLMVLEEQGDSIIRRLNADFAKPWFGRSIHGDVIKLEDMSYLDVLHRMIQLMYVHHQKRWVDSSYIDFIMTIASRWLERLPVSSGNGVDLSHALLANAPDYFLLLFAESCPTANQEGLNPEDLSFFLMECKKPGRKPVNFIPVLNEDFEFYFKKDSLWQSEDVDAVVGQDAERVCILHGPVAAQYSCDENESAKDILDSITISIINRMKQTIAVDDYVPNLDSGQATPESWSTISSLGKDTVGDASTPSFTTLSDSPDDRSVSSGMVSVGSEGCVPTWIRPLFEQKMLLHDRTRRGNPFHAFMLLHPGATTRFHADSVEVYVSEQDQSEPIFSLQSSCGNETDIVAEIYPPRNCDALKLFYKFDPSRSSFGLSEVMEGRNERIRSFYSKIWFGKEVDANISVKDTFHGTQMTLTRDLLDKLILVTGSAFPDHRSLVSDSAVFPIGIGVVIAWEVVSRPLVSSIIDGELLRLVHRSNTFEYCPGASPLRVGDTVNSTSRVQAVYPEDAGTVVIVECQITRSGIPVMVVTSTFLFRGHMADGKGFPGFRLTKEADWNIDINSRLEESILSSREWFHQKDRTASLVGKSLTFSIQTHTRHHADGLRDIHVTGNVFSLLHSIREEKIGTIEFKGESCVGNPVLEFIRRKGKLSKSHTEFTNPGWTGPSSVEVQMPENNQTYAELSKDFNPIHVSDTFASLAGLPGTICHGMCTSAIVERALEHLVLEGNRERLRRFEAKFVAMVLPLEELVVQVEHTGMVEGCMQIGVLALRKGNKEVVMEAEAEVDQPGTAYLFTGQGSQCKGMGMDLYNTSPLAKKLWDEIDKQLYDAYGWSVLEIVKNNPRSLTVHFGGRHGRAIRQKYLSITTEVLLPNGTWAQKPILAGLTPNSVSYTFTNPKGLLYSTQFAQPAILLFEAAAFAELRSGGYVSQGAIYAGHSLGEYGALCALSQHVPTGALVELAFYRGLVIQASVARDDQGGTTYGMLAVNPKRVGKFFDQAALSCLVRTVAESSQELLEIVNFNVEGEQYVCSGTTVNLFVLGKVIDHLATDPEDARLVEEMMKDMNTTTTKLRALVSTFQEQAKLLSLPIQLERGKASIPLEGIDVPFHSSHLRGTVEKFRQCLLRPGFFVDNLDVEQLVGKYIPNLIAKPFSLDEAYIREVFDLTQSPILGEILGL